LLGEGVPVAGTSKLLVHPRLWPPFFKQGAGSSNAIWLKTTTTTEHADSTE
jgi:hypothetical protein